MASGPYLYQKIMDVNGLNGNAGQRQAQLYNQLGAPQGGYTGSLGQNTWLLNQINAGHTGVPQSAAPTQANNGFVPPAPQPITPFSQVMDMSKIFPQSQINAFANSQVAPDINRAQTQATDQLNRTMAANGQYRTGSAVQQLQNLSDSYGRQLKEQTASFSGNVNDWLNNWYNEQYKSYNENPSRYVLPATPTFNSFMQNNPSMASAYNNYAGTPTNTNTGTGTTGM